MSSQGIYGWDFQGTSTCVVGADGGYWVNVLSPTIKRVAKLTSDLQISFTVDLPNSPQQIQVDRQGDLFAVGVSTSPPPLLGPLFKLDPTGTVIFTNPSSVNSIVNQYPKNLILSEDGYPWAGGHHYVGPVMNARLVKCDFTTGNLLAIYDDLSPPQQVSSYFHDIRAIPGGGLWLSSGVLMMEHGQTVGHGRFTHISSAGTKVGSFNFDYFLGNQLRVDAQGNPWLLTSPGASLGQLTLLNRLDPVTGQPTYQYDFGIHTESYVFGPTGEEVYALRLHTCCNPNGDPWELVKLSLVTGQISWVPLWPEFAYAGFFNGDPTGYVYATVIDPMGDNDGDGYANRDEVLQGYNPFDATSHPGGPKVYLWYDTADGNSLHIRYVDPDGVLDPTKGLDASSLQVLATHPLYGTSDVLPGLFAYFTSFDLSPDGTALTLNFGNLKLPKGLGVEIEARVADLTGGVAWDWQMTPQ